jgi:hypothetical protein
LQITVLAIFFIVVSIIIPGYFYWYFSREEKDVGGVDLKNRELFNDLIDNNTVYKNIPAIFGQGLEFKDIKFIDEKEKQKYLFVISEKLLGEIIPEKCA